MKAWLILSVIVFYSCTALAAPNINPMPNDQINFIGTWPDDVNAVLVEDWYTTTDSIFCQHMVGAAGFMPNHFAKRAELMSASNGQRSWLVWRDGIKPGYCGWALQQVVLYLDSKASAADPVRPSNIPIRVAYVCEKSERCGGSWASNDDSDKPTYHRCRFASLNQLARGNSKNSCIFFDEKVRGTDLGKYEHILLPVHHTVQFVITELENNP